jgi:hypothetical protein
VVGCGVGAVAGGGAVVAGCVVVGRAALVVGGVGGAVAAVVVGRGRTVVGGGTMITVIRGAVVDGGGGGTIAADGPAPTSTAADAIRAAVKLTATTAAPRPIWEGSSVLLIRCPGFRARPPRIVTSGAPPVQEIFVRLGSRR